MVQRRLFENSVPPPPPDQGERAKIVKELDRNMLVEAAAGTGKTSSMVGRMAALLGEGKCRVGTMAAVTFTRKAAAELRARFQVALEKAARRSSGPAKERFEDALEHVEQCFIGTIHSFCARLLRERPVEADVDLAFEEMDDEEDALLRREAWAECGARLLADDPDGLLPELGRVGLRLSDLEDAFVAFADYPDVEEWPGSGPERDLPDAGPVVERVRQYVAHMGDLFGELPDDYGNDTLIPAYRRLPRVFSHFDDLTDPAQLAELLSAFARKAKVVLKEWKKTGAFSADEAKAELARWEGFGEEVAKPFIRSWRERRYPIVLKVMFKAREIYDALRHEGGELNYQDLLMKAAALLRDKPHIRAYFRDRFTHLLVDEFQDTDPIQAAVMLLLTADDLKETNWRKCRPRPGSLFVVGDPKQSIYRFRRADIMTYNSVREIMAQGGRCGGRGVVVELRANFRATGPIIGWVNRALESEFPQAATETSPAYRALEKGRVDGSDGDLCGVYVLNVPEEYSTQEEAIEYEADRIARTIRHAVDSGVTVPRTEQQIREGARKAVGPGDFMIITRNRAHLSVYARTLQEYGIPHQVTGGAALNEVGELRLLHACLNAVVQPDNPVSLVAALRGELFGVSDAELYAFKRAGGRFDYGTSVPEDLPSESAEPIRDAFRRLKEYAGWLDRLPLVSAVERMTADLGLTALAAARPGGDVQAGGLAKALELLRQGRTTMWTAAQMAEYVGRLVEMEATYDGISVLSEERAAVRIMNLHKAKGLEAPIVFLADPSGEWDPPVRIHIDRSGDTVRGYMAVSRNPSGYQWETLAHPLEWDELAGREKGFIRAEAARLRYVAATRAGSVLIVTQRAPRHNRRNPWQHFARHLEEAGEIADPGPQRGPAGREEALAARAVSRAGKAVTRRLADAGSLTYDVLPAKAYALSEAAAAPASRGAISFGGADEGSGTVPRDGEHGMEWGAVIHELLELAMASPRAAMEQRAATLLPEHGLGADRAEEAGSMVRAVTHSEIWRRARRSAQCLTEAPFQILETEGAPVPTVLRGAIDLIFKEEDGWVLVDYKTDDLKRKRLEALVEEYGRQVRLYARAWRECTGERVKEMGLFFSQTGEFVPVPVR